ncbi:uncharacterized protein TRIVIDRAFT_70094 [Trichoderma virens Gv29-8]|uniref:Uncharacterized protein n=1 Tax=Hypocrea virens (strain Gv29-8 / FGSC 10586) TaxID=413071 RepID=G9NDT2_HYPVG|nr:uncharacterized protein TRIVIDRAFT_70094 [Trichoderma virens Gv29-8]EHK15182.1 hypothetical protein TRIVIDRAFT_70094 [Trichoderma virens Gv29-8]
MPFWDENAVYCALIGQKPPPPPRVDGGAMHIYNICMLMQRHNRISNLPASADQEALRGGASAGTMFLVHVPSRRLSPPLASPSSSLISSISTPPGSRSVSHLGDTWLGWSGQRAASCLRQCQRHRPEERPPNFACATPDCWVNHPRPRAKPQRKHASRQVGYGNG